MTTTRNRALEPIVLNKLGIKNRLFSSGHQTSLAIDYHVSDSLIAYHESRARGGVGLIITEAAWVDERALSSSVCISLASDECIAGYAKLKDRISPYDCKVFAQLFHPGREYGTAIDGSLSVAFAPSAIPNERYHITPRPLSQVMIQDIIDLYARASRRLARAGIDGLEILASHGYLPSQFLNPHANQRTDKYGGSLENRMRFLREVITEVRREVGRDLVLGIRICPDEVSTFAAEPSEIVDACGAFDDLKLLDYFNVASGSSVDVSSSLHYISPMGVPPDSLVKSAAAIRKRVTVPVLMVGRVTNAGQIDQLLANGTADMVGMARALICDPELPNKIASDRAEDIRECIGCNQACIGHADKGGYSVSCIQNPSSGRELEYRSLVHTGMSRRIVVAGGGPAGMKVAAVAAERGHRVSLFERSATLGGQARLAQLLPSRAEFGGLITNLEREVRMHRVDVHLGTAVSRAFLDELQADIVVVATGARPRRPQLEGIDDARAVDAWSVLKDSSKIGQRVIIADWRCDWIGLGLAEKLAREGCSVRLACTGYMAGESIERRTRDRWIGDLHRVGVEIIPYMRLFGVGDDEVIFQHILSGGAVALAQFDSLVLALGHESDTDLEIELANYAGEIHFLGDCVAPRTAEEAVLDGLRIGSRL